jgi:hypothetical protein
MWQIAEPLYGWALLALVIPVLIHLYNRRRTRVKVLGSVRWLREVQPAQWHFRRIHQWPLFLIRTLLIGGVVLLLLDIYRTGKAGPPPSVHTLILIHPEAGDTLQFRQLGEGWQNDSVRVHWLAPGLPSVAEQIRRADYPYIASLLAEADARFRPDSMHLIAPNRADYLGNTPVRTAAALSWELTDLPGDTIRLLQATLSGDEPELLWFRTGPEETRYWTQTGPANTASGQTEWINERNVIRVRDGATTYEVPVISPDTLSVAGLGTAEHPAEWQTFRAVLEAITGYHNVPVQFTESPANADWIIRLNNDSIQDFNGKPDVYFIYQPSPGTAYLEPIRKDCLLIRKELTPAVILEGGIMQALRPFVLAFKYKQADQPEADYRAVDLPVPTAASAPGYAASAPAEQPSRKLRFWLGIFVLGLVALERTWPKVNG